MGDILVSASTSTAIASMLVKFGGPGIKTVRDWGAVEPESSRLKLKNKSWRWVNSDWCTWGDKDTYRRPLT
jgi:hypothetical protein